MRTMILIVYGGLFVACLLGVASMCWDVWDAGRKAREDRKKDWRSP